MQKLLLCVVAAAVHMPVAWSQGVSVIQSDYPASSLRVSEQKALPFAPPVVAAEQRAVAAPIATPTWRVAADDIRLATTLDRWAKQAGYKLIWDAQKHVLLSSADSFTGSFEDALTRVLSSPAIRRSDYPLEACIYPNIPPVVRVTKLGDQLADCPQ
jgi:hypothetical protein